jgi:hypothetical protein
MGDRWHGRIAEADVRVAHLWRDRVVPPQKQTRGEARYDVDSQKKCSSRKIQESASYFEALRVNTSDKSPVPMSPQGRELTARTDEYQENESEQPQIAVR